MKVINSKLPQSTTPDLLDELVEALAHMMADRYLAMRLAERRETYHIADKDGVSIEVSRGEFIREMRLRFTNRY